ncbi:MAG: UDP-N-acetylmuramate:L-alanyl-gamma-D-glutamyl-meso-diaminopimelate ligase [Chlorobi bacterium]|nr:UDP-N-acetylmuramate:L-alanyl-gamma-D-glutamyl-meso-diaminopimelate ligase [Chlorobiota bacterium]
MKHVYFIGIGGTAMASVASALSRGGIRVTGSDERLYPPMSEYLREAGIPVHEGFDAAHLEPAPDMVVIGNAISRGNPEVEHVLNERLSYCSLPELVGKELIHGNKSVVVTGTHGKTSTAALTAWMLENAGRSPGWLIGGIPKNLGHGCRPASGGIFVTEGDEYDTAFFDKRSKFMHYQPDIVVINGIEYDHADIFPDLEAILLSFRRFLSIIPSRGLLLVRANDHNAGIVTADTLCAKETFGLAGENPDWEAVILEIDANRTRFGVKKNGTNVAAFDVPLFGKHNVLNALAAVTVGITLGLSTAEIQEGLATFQGVKRRMDVVTESDGITLVDDFAHHPTAIRATIEALRTRYPARRVWALFEPRSNTTTRKIFQFDIIQALRNADCVVIGRVHRPERYPPEERLSPAEVAKELKAAGKEAWHIADPGEMVDHVASRIRSGDIVVLMSNGNFGGAVAVLAERIRETNAIRIDINDPAKN